MLCNQKLNRTLGPTTLCRSHVRYGSKADKCSAKRHVRFTPKSRHVRCASTSAVAQPHSWLPALILLTKGARLKGWNVRYGPIADINTHSMISSARASSDGGTARPSALAVLRLSTSSYLVDA